MALFADHDLTTIEDLAGVDHNVLSIAAVEGIDLTKKLALAQQLLIQDISRVLAKDPGQGATYDAGQVVRTPSLRLCHALKALELTYQEAFAGQGVDRFERCRVTYSAEAKRVLTAELERGLPVVLNPLPRPTGPVVTSSAGTGPAGPIDFAVSWINQAGEESSLGTLVAIENSSGEMITVTPPTAPPFATGWIVYASLPGERPGRQYGPLGLNESWRAPDQLSSLGPAGEGQTGNVVLRLSPGTNLLWRG